MGRAARKGKRTAAAGRAERKRGRHLKAPAPSFVFALAPSAIPAGLALVVMGAGGAGFAAMQTTLVYISMPAEQRSRALGVLSVCVGLGLLGFLHLGLLADAIGAPAATALIGAEGLVALVLTRRWWR